MSVNPADAETLKLPALNELHNLLVRCGNGGGKRFEIAQNADTILQIATGQFTEDIRVNQHEGSCCPVVRLTLGSAAR